MSLLSEIKTAISSIVPVETGALSGAAPDTYAVMVPMSDTYELFANDRPTDETQEVRISLFTKGSYTSIKNQIVTALLDAGITVTDRRYIEREDDTGYYHYVIDVAKNYNLEE